MLTEETSELPGVYLRESRWGAQDPKEPPVP